jgi:hypothetical protein
MKTLRSFGWRWLTRLKGNRLVDTYHSGNRHVSEVEVPPVSRIVHLKGYGMVKMFRFASRDGDAEHWATDDLEMQEEERKILSSRGWGIKTYPRGCQAVLWDREGPSERSLCSAKPPDVFHKGLHTAGGPQAEEGRELVRG